MNNDENLWNGKGSLDLMKKLLVKLNDRIMGEMFEKNGILRKL